MRVILVATVLSCVSAPAYVRVTTRAGTPLRRTDVTNIPFTVNRATAAGMNNADGFPIVTAGSDPIGALRAAMATWNAVPSSAARFGALEPSSLANNPTDGVSAFVFQDTPEIRSILGSALALTTVQYLQDGRIIDTDILFNPNLVIQGQHYSFSTNLAAGTFDIQSVATHELGHTLGANHSPLLAASMFQATGPASDLQGKLSSDDIAFVTEAYPTPASAGAFGAISGRISFSGGGTVRGASVVAIDPATGVAISGLSGADGAYSIAKLPPGNYLVYAEPLDGPVLPANLGLADAEVDTSFQTSFYGGLSNPLPIPISGGTAARADIAVSRGPSPVRIKFIGTGSVGDSDFGRFSLDPIRLKAGQSLDLMLVGPGLDRSLTPDEVRLLGPGLTIRPDSLRFPNVTVNGMPVVRLTVDIGPHAEPALASLIVAKGSAAGSFSGGLSIGPSAPSFAAGTVVNAASFRGGAVAPGEIVSIFGTGLGPDTPVPNNGFDPQTGAMPTTLGEAKISFDGVPAPLFFVSATQINLQVPFEIAGRSSTNVEIQFQRLTSEKIAVPVVAAAPGIFTAVLNEDGSLNSTSNPAAKGSVVTLFATGLGAVDPPVATGRPAEGSPSRTNAVTAAVDGRSAPVLFAGMAPGFVGLMQINITIPQEASTGSAAPIEIAVNGVRSQAGPAVAVR